MLDRLSEAATDFAEIGDSFDEAREQVLSGDMTDRPADVLIEVNALLRAVERDLTRAEGLAGRPWLRNLVFAADRDNGYANIAFPAITEALEDGDRAGVEAEVDEMIHRIGRAGERLASARRLLVDSR